MRPIVLLLAIVGTSGCAGTPTLVHAQSGTTSTLEQLGGRALVITFWAEFCQPCVDQALLLAASAAEVSKDVLVIPVYYRPRPDDGLDGWWKDEPAEFAAIACWANWPFLRRFDLTSIPRTYVIGRDGKQLELFKGTLTEQQRPVYQGAIRRALATPVPQPN